MNKKILLSALTFLTIIFLTAQTCQFSAVSTGLAADCEGGGDVVCNDDLEAYQCHVMTYGLGYFVTRMDIASDIEYCEAEEVPEEEEGTEEEVPVMEVPEEEEGTEEEVPAEEEEGVDSDVDGLLDSEEETLGTDPNDADSDDDGDVDGEEIENETDPLDSDSDNDGLLDGEEGDIGTYRLDADSDNDGLTDFEEIASLPATDPLDADSDDDGLSDSEEATAGTIPTLADTDADGLSDGDEVNTYGTEPTDRDTDDDGFLDGQEIQYGADPFDTDSDDDGLLDGDELTYGASPTVEDSDSDGLLDGIEVAHGFDPQDNELDSYVVVDLMTSGSTVLDYNDVYVGRLNQPQFDVKTEYFIFNGTQSLNFPDEDALDLTTWVIIDAVVKTDASALSSTGAIVGKNVDGDTCIDPYNAYLLRQYNGQFQFAVTADYGTRFFAFDTEHSVSDDWTRVTAVWSSSSDSQMGEGTMSLYVDGVLVGEKTQADELLVTTGSLWIGKGCGNYFKGSIKELHVWGGR